MHHYGKSHVYSYILVYVSSNDLQIITGGLHAHVRTNVLCVSYNTKSAMMGMNALTIWIVFQINCKVI